MRDDTVYDIFPWRFTADGGTPFVIGGDNFSGHAELGRVHSNGGATCARRAEEGWPAVARMGRDAIEGFGDDSSEVFPIRHPQHIPLAGVLGLGVFDRQKIDHQRVSLG